MTSITVATEDELSEAVANRLALEAGLNVVRNLRKDGFGYLKSKIPNFCNIANKVQPVFMLTDLDHAKCALSLKDDWFKESECPKNLIFRVAVCEVEAWLLADKTGMESIIGHQSRRIPSSVDNIRDAKIYLLKLAASASAKTRKELTATSGSVARQGLQYNARLSEFVRTTWCPEKASVNSESLRKARLRLFDLANS